MTIFDKNYISKKSSESGFNRDTYEKVLRLVDVLEFVNHDEFLNERLALKGGTAINLLELDLPRLSVDIDLDYLNNVDVEQMKRDREEISARILKFMEQKGYLRNKSDRMSFVLDSYYFSYINSGGNKDNIKFDINYVMRAHIYKAIKRNVLTDLFQVDGGVNSLSSLEIYGSKINALNNRAAVRDLYDVYKLINKKFLFEKKDQLRKTVIFYHVLTSDKIDGDFTLKSTDKLNQHSILRELVPVLKKSEVFLLKDALGLVRSFVNELMNITDKEKDFIRKFCNREYCPELLFENTIILNNIKNHPMAMWKTRK